MSLKTKVVSGLSWSFTENIANSGLTFIIGLILARLLSPSEFGLIAMVTVFTALSTTFIDSGLSAALIRKKNCTQADYSTVFYYNLSVGVILFIALYYSASAISKFYQRPELVPIIRVMAWSFILNSFGQIQRIIIIKRLDFKLKTKISVVASLLSGTIGIAMAYMGWGVWSLVVRTLSNSLFALMFLWMWNKWTPSFFFSKKSFEELFGFGIKFFFSGFINTVYKNIFLLVIGKYFSPADLGYYTRADRFKNLPSTNLSSIIKQVTYPALSTMQDNPVKLKASYKKLITGTMLLSFVLMIGMAAVAESMILALIGSKWEPSIILLQMLTFVGMFYPLHALNINMLAVVGKPGLILRLELIKKIIVVPVLVFGVMYGMKVLIIGMMINTVIAFYLNSYYSGKFIHYSLREQVFDIAPSFFIAFLMGFMVFLSGEIMNFGNLLKLILQILFGGVIAIGLSELFKLESYLYIKGIVREKVITVYYDRRR